MNSVILRARFRCRRLTLTSLGGSVPVAILVLLLGFAVLSLPVPVSGQSITIAGSDLLEEGEEEFSSVMVEGIGRFLTAETERVREARDGRWQRDFSSVEAFGRSIASERELLARRLGVVDERAAPALEVLTNAELGQYVVESEGSIIRAVRWSVLEGRYNEMMAEGVLLQPKGEVRARVVMLPDADVVPEVLAGLQERDAPGYGVARQLAEAGVEVLVPVLVNREDTFSGSEVVGRYTNQPHREWIYRQGFVLGRHVIGYELQKVFAAIDWFEVRNDTEGKELPTGVVGHGEGGLLALHAAALDERISSTLVSGYFDAREDVWREPIYRNVFGLLQHFGDAELAAMAWPRRLVVEHAAAPEVLGPPAESEGRSGAAPGRISTPTFSTAKAEWERARELLPADRHDLHWHADGESAFARPFSPAALSTFAGGLDVGVSESVEETPPLLEPGDWIEAERRQERTVRGMEQHVQRVLALSEKTREEEFWQTLEEEAASQESIIETHRERFWEEAIGRLPAPSVPASPRTRLLEETDEWTSYEVRLDVWPEVVAGGILLVPNDLDLDEEHPAVVAQHGLSGVPMDLITTDPETRAFEVYQGYAARLAEQGYVVFAPELPYCNEDKCRQLQRKANPLGLSLYSVITGQHERIVEWLGEQPYVDAGRIGFYGLSYGGKTAMRVPALVEGYALSISSGDFNEWIRKVASTDYDAYNSYPFTGEYEIPEWNLGHTFGYAEMAALIAPRPFMVERGHHDGVGKDEWVAYEYAKVRRYYRALGIPERTRIEFFEGGHEIHGVGTFEFLDQHLRSH